MRNTIKTLTEKLPGAFRYILLLAVIVLISFLFPDNPSFKYNYEEGKQWRYEDLVAPFDFPIYKSDEELKKEQKTILENFSPYYTYDNEVYIQQSTSFEQQFDKAAAQSAESGFKDVAARPKVYRNYGLNLLSRIYDRGVVNIEKEHLEKGGGFVINILKNNTVFPQTIESTSNLQDVLLLLSDSLPYSRLREPEFLLPLLSDHIQPNVFYSDSLSNVFKQKMLNEISSTNGMVSKGDVVVSRGEILTGETFKKVDSYKRNFEQEVSNKRQGIYLFAGYLLLTSLILIIFFIYLRNYAPEAYFKIHHLLFILIWPLIFGYLVFLIEGTDVLSAYLIPFAIAPILLRSFFNARVALITHITVVLIASFLTSLGYEFTLMQILAGIMILVSDVNTRNWSKFFNLILFLFITYSLSYLGLSLIQEGSLEKIDVSVFPWLLLNVFLVLLAPPLIPLFERLFGFVSQYTLLELADMNRPLLRDLAIKAPGTFQHSLQVANLAEAAALKIGADPLLIKVGALYHDIGKMKNPDYFIENNPGDSPHDDIDMLQSAKIIIGHVTDGVAMAKKAGLPEVIVDFIRTHHGTTRTEYFYRNYIKEHPKEEGNDLDFKYPGPNSTTKEQSIMMIADSVEAACKSIKNPTAESLFGLIDKIVAGKISAGQLVDSELSFKELEEVVKVIKNVMKSVYHARIEYPDEKK